MTGLFWAVTAAALALDVGSKLWAVHSLGQRVTVLPGVLELRLSRNDGMALGVVEAVKESGKDILIVGVDGIGEAYDSIRKGELSATIDSFPFYKAQIALECALRELAGQELPRVIWTPQALIDSTNVDMDAKEIINWVPTEYKAQ